MKKKIVIPALLSLFISFSAVAQDQHQKESNKENRAEHRKEHLEELTNTLELNEEQVAQVKTLMQQKHERMQALKAERPSDSMTDEAKKQARMERMKVRKTIMEEHQQQMKEVLTPEQYEKYIVFKEEHHQQGKKHKHLNHGEMEVHPTKGEEHMPQHEKGEPHKH